MNNALASSLLMEAKKTNELLKIMKEQHEKDVDELFNLLATVFNLVTPEGEQQVPQTEDKK